MSEFEFLGKIALGQYLPLNSWLHRRDPRAKLISGVALVLAMSLTNNLSGIAIGILIAFFLAALAKLPIRLLLRTLLSPLPFILILAVLQIFIFPHNPDSKLTGSILGFPVYTDGLLAAARLFLRFLNLIMLISVFSACISTLEMMHGIELLSGHLWLLRRWISQFGMALQVAMRFVPFLAINAEKIAKAQAARGAEWGTGKGNLFKKARMVLPLLVPLFNTSLRQAETLADAMLARGFVAGKPRTGLMEYGMQTGDWFLLFSCFLGATAIVFI